MVLKSVCLEALKDREVNSSTERKSKYETKTDINEIMEGKYLKN